jgi:hypothetical protein
MLCTVVFYSKRLTKYYPNYLLYSVLIGKQPPISSKFCYQLGAVFMIKHQVEPTTCRPYFTSLGQYKPVNGRYNRHNI